MVSAFKRGTVDWVAVTNKPTTFERSSNAVVTVVVAFVSIVTSLFGNANQWMMRTIQY
jgi:hypothetical protein